MLHFWEEGEWDARGVGGEGVDFNDFFDELASFRVNREKFHERQFIMAFIGICIGIFREKLYQSFF